MKEQIKNAIRRFVVRLVLQGARKLLDAADDRLHAAEEAFDKEFRSTARAKVQGAAVRVEAGRPPKHQSKKTARVQVPEALAMLAQRLLSSGLSAGETGSALKNMGYSASESTAAVEQFSGAARRPAFKVSLADITQALEA